MIRYNYCNKPIKVNRRIILLADFILAIDQGTTSCRSIIFNKTGTIVSSAQKEISQIFPHPGWVEHDPEEILASQVSVVHESLLKARLSYKDILSQCQTRNRFLASI